MRDVSSRRSLINRLTNSERHGQRWNLQVPCPGDSYATARPLLTLLGLPTLGLAFGISVMTTYGPLVLAHLTSPSAKVGALIGGEGAFALAVPLLAGAVSDRLPGTALRRRMPFVAVGAPLAAFGLITLPFAHSVALAGAAILFFFVGYYAYYPPYRALYADLLPRSFYARAQSSQAILRGAGLGVALLAGGLLLSAWRPLPFLLAGLVTIAVTFALVPIIRLDSACTNDTLPYEGGSIARLLHNPPMRAFAAANAMWEFSFAGLKSFIVLYVVRGLDQSASVASGVIAVVAAAYIVGAPLAGRLADRYGIRRVLQVSSAIYGTGLLFGLFPTSIGPMVGGLVPIALAGAVTLTLPQALAFTLAPHGTEGAVAGLQDFSRGLGLVLGPVVVGAAVDAFRPELTATDGYAAMWPVIGVPVLLSVLLLRLIGDPDEAPAGGRELTPSESKP
jgi:MFS family permease